MRMFLTKNTFLNLIKPELVQKLSKLANIRTVKFNLKLEATYNRPNVKNSADNRAFKSAAKAFVSYSNVNKILDETFSILLAEQDAYAGKGSGFTLQCIDGLLLGIYHHTSMNGSSCIPLPTDIATRKAVKNPQNQDQQSFKCATQLTRHVIDHNHRIKTNYSNEEHRYKSSGIHFPIPFRK